jgi:predicted SAM-dependent methyltransferase
LVFPARAACGRVACIVVGPLELSEHDAQKQNIHGQGVPAENDQGVTRLTIKSTVSASLKNTLPVGLFSGIKLLGNEIILHRLHRIGVKKARAYAGKAGLKLNIGCGPNRKQGWINIDLSPEAELSLDMRERIPFDDGSAAIIYSEHFFEHLDYPNDAKHFLRECFRVLEPDGIFRVGVPDTLLPLLDYAGVGDGRWLQACKNKEFWRPEWCKTTMDHINYHFRQDTEHRYAYDFETLENVLKEVGFIEIKSQPSSRELQSATPRSWRRCAR